MCAKSRLLKNGLWWLVVSLAANGCGKDGNKPTFATSLVLRDASGQPSISFGQGQAITFDLAVTNQTNGPQTLRFPTGRQFDLLVLGQGGNTILWQWSTGKLFIQAFTTLDFQPNETKVLTATWDQIDNAQNPMTTGAFDAQGYLSTGGESENTSNGVFEPSELRSPRMTFQIQ